MIGAAAAAVAVLRGNVAMAHRCGLGLLGAGFLVAFGVMLSAEYTAKECTMVPGMGHARRLATALLEGPMASYFEGRHGYTKLHAMIAAGLAATAVTVLGAASAPAHPAASTLALQLVDAQCPKQPPKQSPQGAHRLQPSPRAAGRRGRSRA